MLSDKIGSYLVNFSKNIDDEIKSNFDELMKLDIEKDFKKDRKYYKLVDNIRNLIEKKYPEFKKLSNVNENFIKNDLPISSWQKEFHKFDRLREYYGSDYPKFYYVGKPIDQKYEYEDFDYEGLDDSATNIMFANALKDRHEYPIIAIVAFTDLSGINKNKMERMAYEIRYNVDKNSLMLYDDTYFHSFGSSLVGKPINNIKSTIIEFLTKCKSATDDQKLLSKANLAKWNDMYGSYRKEVTKEEINKELVKYLDSAIKFINSTI